MEEKQSSVKWTPRYDQMIFNKGAKIFQWERIIFQQVEVEDWYSYVKNEVVSIIKMHTKVKS